MAQTRAQLGTAGSGRGPAALTPPLGQCGGSQGGAATQGPPQPRAPDRTLWPGLFSFSRELQLTQFRKHWLAGGGGGAQRSSSVHVLHTPARLVNGFQTRTGAQAGMGAQGPGQGGRRDPRAEEGKRLWVGGHGLGDTVTKGPVSTESPPCQVGQSWGVTAGPQE